MTNSLPPNRETMSPVLTVSVKRLATCFNASSPASKSVLTRQGDQVSVGCSVGVSIYSGADESLKDLIKQADQALYKVKDQGRGFFVIHQEDS